MLSPENKTQEPDFPDEAWTSFVTHYLVDNKRKSVTMSEVLTICLMIPVSRIDEVSETRVRKILKNLGCVSSLRSVGGRSEPVYEVPSSMFKE